MPSAFPILPNCRRPLAGKWSRKDPPSRVLRRRKSPSPCGEVVKERPLIYQSNTTRRRRPLAGKWSRKDGNGGLLFDASTVAVPLRGSGQGKTIALLLALPALANGRRPLAGKWSRKAEEPQRDQVSQVSPSPCGEVVKERRSNLRRFRWR